MIIVSGLRRSGTSMMMYALKQAGIKIAGQQFLVDNLIDKHRKGGVSKELKDKREKTIEANPNGYWEVDGICKHGLKESVKGEAIKVMFEGLSLSDPKLIDKAIIMVRKPRKALYSMFKDNQIDYPDIFIVKQAVDTIDALLYLYNNNIPYRIFLYDKLMVEPEDIARAIKFIGKGDEAKAIKSIDPKLNRSKKIEMLKYVDLLELMYRYLKLNKVNKVLALQPFVGELANRLLEQYDNQTR